MFLLVAFLLFNISRTLEADPWELCRYKEPRLYYGALAHLLLLLYQIITLYSYISYNFICQLCFNKVGKNTHYSASLGKFKLLQNDNILNLRYYNNSIDKQLGNWVEDLKLHLNHYKRIKLFFITSGVQNERKRKREDIKTILKLPNSWERESHVTRKHEQILKGLAHQGCSRQSCVINNSQYEGLADVRELSIESPWILPTLLIFSWRRKNLGGTAHSLGLRRERPSRTCKSALHCPLPCAL